MLRKRNIWSWYFLHYTSRRLTVLFTASHETRSLPILYGRHKKSEFKGMRGLLSGCGVKRGFPKRSRKRRKAQGCCSALARSLGSCWHRNDPKPGLARRNHNLSGHQGSRALLQDHFSPCSEVGRGELRAEDRRQLG